MTGVDKSLRELRVQLQRRQGVTGAQAFKTQVTLGDVSVHSLRVEGPSTRKLIVKRYVPSFAANPSPLKAQLVQAVSARVRRSGPCST